MIKKADKKAARKAKKDKKSKKSKKSKKDKKKKSESSSSSSSSSSDKSATSVFREATKSRSKSSQDELIKFARKNPGLLACSTMQTWDNLSARTGDMQSYKKFSMPPCAKRFFLNVVRPSVPQDRANRNIREIEILAHVADLIATSNFAQAADVVTQRMVACRLAEEEKTWTNAHFMELVPLDSLDMVPKSMRLLAQREADSERRSKAKRSPTSANDWYEQDGWKGKGGKPWKPWNKGKGKDGKDGKGDKNVKGAKGGKPWWKGDKDGKNRKGWY